MGVGGSSNDDVIHPARDVSEDEQQTSYLVFSFLLFSVCCLSSLTHTPDITSGHGWTLVNVGFTMAIAILDEKGVGGEKMKKGSSMKK